MADNEAVFNEVIRVGVDLTDFESNLDTMIETYKSAMGRMSAAGIDVGSISNVADLGALSSQIAQVSEQINNLATGLADVFSLTTSEASAAATKASDAAIGAARATTDAMAEEADKQLAMAARKYSEQLRMFEEMQGLQVDAQQAALEKMSAADAQWFARNQRDNGENLRQLALNEQTGPEAMTDTQIGDLQDRAARDERMKRARSDDEAIQGIQIQAERDDTYNRYRSPEERVQGAQVQATLENQSRDSKQQAAQEKQIDSDVNAYQTAEERKNAQMSRMWAENDAMADAEMAKAQQLYERDAAAQEVSEQRKVAQAEAAYEKIAAATDSLYDKIQADQEKAVLASQRASEKMAAPSQVPSVGGQGFFSRFGAGFSMGGDSGDMAEFLGNVTRFSLAWGAVGAVIGGIRDTFGAIVDQFKAGWQYLNDIQENTVQLQGVLVNNLQLAGGIDDKFRSTAQLAGEIVNKINEIAKTDNLDPKQLQESYASALNTGMAHFIPTASGQLQFITDLNLAIKATASGSAELRKGIEDIPLLFSGAIAPSSKLLEILGLSKDQWIQIRDTSAQHADLLDKIDPQLASMAEEGKKLGDTQVGAMGQLSQTIKEITADVDKPIFDKWTDSAQRLTKYLEDHKGAIESFFGAKPDGVISPGHKLSEDQLAHVDQLEGLSPDVEARGQAKMDSVKAFIGSWLAFTKNTTYGGAFDELVKSTGGDKLKELGLDGPSTGPAVGPSAMDFPMAGKGGPPTGDGTQYPGQKQLDALVNQYKQAVEAIRNSENSLRDDTKQMMADRLTSVQD